MIVKRVIGTPITVSVPVTITRVVTVTVRGEAGAGAVEKGGFVRYGPARFMTDTFAGATGNIITKPVTVKDLRKDRELVKKAEKAIRERREWAEFLKEEAGPEHEMNAEEEPKPGYEATARAGAGAPAPAQKSGWGPQAVKETAEMEHQLASGEGIDRQAEASDVATAINRAIQMLKEDLVLADSLAPRLRQDEYDSLVGKIKDAISKLQSASESLGSNIDEKSIIKKVLPEITLAALLHQELAKWAGRPGGEAAKLIKQLREGRPVTVKTIQSETGPDWETRLRWGFEKLANYAFFPIMLGNRAAGYLMKLSKSTSNPILSKIYWGLSKVAQGAGYVGAGVEVAGLTAATGGAAGIAFAAIGAAQLADTLDRAFSDPIYHKELEEFLSKLREGNPDAWADVAAIAAGMAVAGAGLKGLGDITIGDTTLSDMIYRNISLRFSKLAEKAREMGYGKVADMLERLADRYARRAGAVKAKVVELPEKESVSVDLLKDVKGGSQAKLVIRYLEQGSYRTVGREAALPRIPEGFVRQVMRAYGVDRDTAEAAAYELAEEYKAYGKLHSIEDLTPAERKALSSIVAVLKGTRIVKGTEYFGRPTEAVMKALGKEEALARIAEGRKVYVSMAGDEYVAGAPPGRTVVRIANPKTGAAATVVMSRDGRVENVFVSGNDGETYFIGNPDFMEALRRYGFGSLRDLLRKAGIDVKGNVGDEGLLVALKARYGRAVKEGATRASAVRTKNKVFAVIEKEQEMKPERSLGEVKATDGGEESMDVSMYRVAGNYVVIRATAPKEFSDTASPDDIYIVVNRRTGRAEAYVRSSTSPARRVPEGEALDLLRKYGFRGFDDLLRWARERGADIPRNTKVTYAGSGPPKAGDLTLEEREGKIIVRSRTGVIADYSNMEDTVKSLATPPALRHAVWRTSTEDVWARPVRFRSVAVGSAKGFARMIAGRGTEVIVDGKKYYIPADVRQTEIYMPEGRYRVQVDWVIDVGSPENAARFVRAFNAVKDKIIQELKAGKTADEVFADVRGVWRELMRGKGRRAGAGEWIRFRERRPSPAGEDAEEAGASNGDDALLMKVIRDIKERMGRDKGNKNEIVMVLKNRRGGYAVAGATVAAATTSKAEARSASQGETIKEGRAREGSGEGARLTPPALIPNGMDLRKMEERARRRRATPSGSASSRGKHGQTQKLKTKRRTSGGELSRQPAGAPPPSPPPAGGMRGPKAMRRRKAGGMPSGGSERPKLKRVPSNTPPDTMRAVPKPKPLRNGPEPSESGGRQEEGQKTRNAGSRGKAGQETQATQKPKAKNTPQGTARASIVTITEEVTVQIPYFKIVQIPIDIKSSKPREEGGEPAPPAPALPPAPIPLPLTKQQGYVLPTVIRPPRRRGQGEIVTL